MKKYALVGNQNSGKSTLFYALTGTPVKVGNYPGVTVEKKAGLLKTKNAVIYDLPGTLSLSAASEDERLAISALGEVDGVINVLDGTTAGRGLYLTLELLEKKVPIIVVLTKTKKDASVEKALGQMLGVKILTYDKNSIGEILCEIGKGRFKIGSQKPSDIEERYKMIGNILNKVPFHKCKSPLSKADTFILKSSLSPFVVLTLAAVAVLLCAGIPGKLFSPLTALFQKVLLSISQILPLPYGLQLITQDCFIPCVMSLIQFLPTVVSVFFLLSVLENSGFMTRIFMLFDKTMCRLGLSGKSTAPLIVGLGCTAGATVMCRCEERPQKRAAALKLLPFVPCSAKLPVFIFLLSLFSPISRATAIVFLYIFSIFTGIVVTKEDKKAKKKSYLLCELPPVSIPAFSIIVRPALEKCRSFLTKVFFPVFISSLVLMFFSSFTSSLTPASTPEKSILGQIGSYLVFLLKPLGLDSPIFAIALISGLFAKETIISSLTVLTATSGLPLTPASAVSLTVFVLFYPPCITTLVSIWREESFSFAAKMFLRHLVIAWCMSFISFRIVSLI